MSYSNRINSQIRSEKVNLVLKDGKMGGVFYTREAIVMAREDDLDLVEVSPASNGKLPICKILDYGKIQYNNKKKTKSNKHENQVKGIRIGYTTSEHDLEFKHRNVKEFLSKNHKVRYFMRLKGRQNNMADEAMKKFKKYIEEFSDIAKWSEPKYAGGVISTVLIPSG